MPARFSLPQVLFQRQLPPSRAKRASERAKNFRLPRATGAFSPAWSTGYQSPEKRKQKKQRLQLFLLQLALLLVPHLQDTSSSPQPAPTLSQVSPQPSAPLILLHLAHNPLHVPDPNPASPLPNPPLGLAPPKSLLPPTRRLHHFVPKSTSASSQHSGLRHANHASHPCINLGLLFPSPKFRYEQYIPCILLSPAGWNLIIFLSVCVMQY